MGYDQWRHGFKCLIIFKVNEFLSQMLLDQMHIDILRIVISMNIIFRNYCVDFTLQIKDTLYFYRNGSL